MRIISWNVNGIRAVHNKKLFLPFIEKYQPDILCLQETKATREQLLTDLGYAPKLLHFDAPVSATAEQSEPYKSTVIEHRKVATKRSAKKDVGVLGSAEQQDILLHKFGYHEYWYSAEKKGYSGTAIFTKQKPLSVVNGLPSDIIKKYKISNDGYGDPSQEGRVITAEFENFFVVTVYTPNAKEDLSRVKLRHKQWDPAFLAHCKSLELKKPVIFCGDLNVAHTSEDLARPKENIGKKGFTKEEIEGFNNFIKAGFVDTFRLFTKGNGHYTWWTHWANARVRNVGWRIDYVLISADLKPKVKSAKIHDDIMGSDHCPVSIEIDL